MYNRLLIKTPQTVNAVQSKVSWLHSFPFWTLDLNWKSWSVQQKRFLSTVKSHVEQLAIKIDGFMSISNPKRVKIRSLHFCLAFLFEVVQLENIQLLGNYFGEFETDYVRWKSVLKCARKTKWNICFRRIHLKWGTISFSCSDTSFTKDCRISFDWVLFLKEQL